MSQTVLYNNKKSVSILLTLTGVVTFLITTISFYSKTGEVMFAILGPLFSLIVIVRFVFVTKKISFSNGSFIIEYLFFRKRDVQIELENIEFAIFDVETYKSVRGEDAKITIRTKTKDTYLFEIEQSAIKEIEAIRMILMENDIPFKLN